MPAGTSDCWTVAMRLDSEIVPVAISVPVTTPSAISEVPTAPAAMLPARIVSVAILMVVTAPAAMSAVAIVPSRISREL